MDDLLKLLILKYVCERENYFLILSKKKIHKLFLDIIYIEIMVNYIFSPYKMINFVFCFYKIFLQLLALQICIFHMNFLMI